MSFLVLNECTVIDMLFFIADSKAVYVCFRTFSVKCNLNIVTSETVCQCYVAVIETALLFLIYV